MKFTVCITQKIPYAPPLGRRGAQIMYSTIRENNFPYNLPKIRGSDFNRNNVVGVALRSMEIANGQSQIRTPLPCPNFHFLPRPRSERGSNFWQIAISLCAISISFRACPDTTPLPGCVHLKIVKTSTACILVTSCFNYKF